MTRPPAADPKPQAKTTAAPALSAEAIAAIFDDGAGGYAFARWRRPIAPVIFGLEAENLPVFKGAIEAVVTLAGHKMAETDPELGANLMLFFLREWDELRHLDHLDHVLPDLGGLVARLEARDANQYRLFRFDAAGAICAVFAFVRLDAALAQTAAEDIALAQAAQMILRWPGAAFRQRPLLTARGGRTQLHPDIAALIRAAYDPVLPDATDDPAHAWRLAARLAVAAGPSQAPQEPEAP